MCAWWKSDISGQHLVLKLWNCPRNCLITPEALEGQGLPISSLQCSGDVYSLASGRFGCNFKILIFKFKSMISWVFLVAFSSGECHETSPTRRQHSISSCLGAIRHQAITWAKLARSMLPCGITRPQWVKAICIMTFLFSWFRLFMILELYLLSTLVD